MNEPSKEAMAAAEEIENLVGFIANSKTENVAKIIDMHMNASNNEFARVPASLLFDKDVWIEYCEESGVNSWCVSEGQADMEDTFPVTLVQVGKWDLLG